MEIVIFSTKGHVAVVRKIRNPDIPPGNQCVQIIESRLYIYYIMNN